MALPPIPAATYWGEAYEVVSNKLALLLLARYIRNWAFLSGTNEAFKF